MHYERTVDTTPVYNNTNSIHMASLYPKAYFNNNVDIKRTSAFIIMPFAAQFDEVHIAIKHALEAQPLNFECRRGDDFKEPHIINTILAGIAESEYIIVDLTGANANVFYELGLAHCIKDIDKVILISQDVESIPFDVNQFRCISYSNSKDGLEYVCNEIIETICDPKNIIRVDIEGETTKLDKKIFGERKFLYSMTFKCLHYGHDGIKLSVEYVRHGAHGPNVDMEGHGFFLGEEEREVKLKYIPWNLIFLESNEEAQSASLLLERKKN